MIFKGHEELKNMNKSELINLWKDTVNPDRKKGGVFYIEKKLRNDNKRTKYIIEKRGTNMSEYRPMVGDDEYTWGEMKKYPAMMVRLFLYQHLTKGIGEEE